MASQPYSRAASQVSSSIPFPAAGPGATAVPSAMKKGHPGEGAGSQAADAGSRAPRSFASSRPHPSALKKGFFQQVPRAAPKAQERDAGLPFVGAGKEL